MKKSIQICKYVGWDNRFFLIPEYVSGKKVLSAAVAGCLAGALSSLAYAADTPEAQYLDTVTVTATGHETETLSTPHAITVLGREAIEQSSANNAGDLLRGEPGIAVASDGAWGMNPVLRGLKKEQIVIMIDGMRLNSAQPYGAIASFVNLDQVQRVEVVKGPVSVLYGSGAMGGVVNFITRKVDFSKEPQMVGSVNFGASSADERLRSGATLGLSNENHALNLSVSALEVDNYESPEGEVENTGYKQQAIAANYRMRAGEKGTIELNLQQQQDEDVWYPGSAKSHAFHNTLTIHSPKQERSLYELAYETELAGESEPHLRVNVYQQEVDRTIYAFSETLQRNVVRTNVSFSTLGAGVRLDLSPNDRHLLSAGLDAWKMEGDPARYMDTNAPNFNNNVRNDPFSQGRIDSAGVYLQDEITLDKWNIKAGLRYDRITGDAEAAAGLPTGSDLEHTDNTASWSLGTVYSASPALNPYVNLGRAYRAADMRERFESSTRGDGYYHQGNPQLDPEVNTTLELGIKGAAGQTRYAFAVYHSKINNYITGRITGGTHAGTGLPIKVTENLAEVSLTGLEAELEYGLGNHTAVFTSFSYLRGENEYDNEPLAEIPPAELSLGLRHTSKRSWNWDLTTRVVAKQDRVGTKLTNGTEDATPGFATTAVGIGYRFGSGMGLTSSTVRLVVNNLFDKSYYEHLTTGVSGNESLATGRNIHLTWNGEF